ncbi:hypothetical protein QJS10_CPB22g00103 [Acorus calamus]|uniref:Uncharacterized protein n=1 Tax=Acorus calamus TaxID=4465 RepID=A0AAV9BZF6_ACOCL|nr:hypothetical protein QJS10_CPB22g00103 [Acorus calamus]
MRSDFFGPTKGSSAAAAGFFAHAQFGNGGSTASLPPAVVPLQLSNGSGGGNHQQQHNHHQAEMQQFPFLQDHLIPVDGLNFLISSSPSSGFNRGTLQSNSAIAAAQLPPHNYHHHHHQQHPQHQLHQLNRQHFQRLSSPIVDGPTNNLPFFFATTAAAATAPGPATEAQLVGFDSRGLQLYYDDGGCRNSDLKGKGKG